MPVVAFVDPDTVHNPSSGGIAPASWFTTLEADFRSITGRVGCSLTESGAQDVATPGTSTLTLGTVEWNNGMTTSTANTIKVPASYAGKYMISATFRIVNTGPTAANSTILDVMLNGTSIYREYAARSGASGSSQGMGCSFPYPLAVNDLLTLSTTASADITDADTEVSQIFTTLAAVWLSA
jgi:hypothetical protein